MQNMHISHRYALPQRMPPSRRKMYFSPGVNSSNDHGRNAGMESSFNQNQMHKNQNQIHHLYPYQTYCNQGNMTDNVGDHNHQNQMPRKEIYNLSRNGEQCARHPMYYSRGHAQDSKHWRTQSQYIRCPRNGSVDKSSSNPDEIQVKYPIVPLFFRQSDDHWTSARPKLNAAAVAFTMKGAGLNSGPRISLPTAIDLTVGLVTKPTWRTAPAVGHLLPSAKRSQLNAAAPEFQPGLRGYQGSTQALRGTQVGVNPTMGMDLNGMPPSIQESQYSHNLPETTQCYPATTRQNKRYRKQPLPDLFAPVLALMRGSKRSVSYPEIINALSVRLQRPEVELKRHVPHTLQLAVHNGYLSKLGNRYTLRSEKEHLEIMRRNKEAALRAKELEKEPLSWRKR
ncbi:uncharacterized protein LOC108165242 [Drosophila miranda]|uniref:uncharacterized protein LOC108165242 n=1 Tax=Drosophila miranda TaxID=7229 RepID=UPI0007E68436|nr:uncharacterized protein LOC108165242 [Drosophila miranda]